MKNIISKYKKLSIITKASVWAFIANVVQRGVTVIATPLFTRILTTEEYAQYTLYQSWHDIFIIFVSMNVFNYCTYSAMKEYEDDRDGFIATAQTLTTGLAIICFALYYFVQIICGNVLGFPLPIVILMFVDMVFFASFNLWCTKKRYEFKYRVMTFLSILIGIMGPVLGVLAIYYLPNKGYGRIYGVAAINILVGLIIYIYNISKSKKIFNLKYVKFIFVYCIPLIPHFLASQILARFDRIMIGDICGESQAGIYSLAYSLSLLLMIFNDAILKSLTPWTYQTIKKSNSAGLNKLKTTATNMVLFVAAANIGLILFAPEAIKIFATSEYYEAIYIIPPVSASVFFTFLFNISWTYLHITVHNSTTFLLSAAYTFNDEHLIPSIISICCGLKVIPKLIILSIM